ncbi:hypothetical protein JCM9279_005385 [Rhodotorula babjevae]
MHARPLSPCSGPSAHPEQPSSTSRRRRSTANTLNPDRTSLSLDTGRDCLGGLGTALQHRGAWTGAAEAHLHPRAGLAARRAGGPSGGSAASLHGCASDSAYGTLDELEPSLVDEEHDEDEAVEDALAWASERGPAWKDRVEASLTERSRRRVQSAVAADGWQLRDGARGGEAGDGLYWRRALGTSSSSQVHTAQSSPDVAQEPVFSFDLAYDADSSFDSLHSLCPPFAAHHHSASMSRCSSRSSPEPSECGESDSAATRLTMARRRRTSSFLGGGETVEELATSFLARRHTLPRRHKAREVGRKPSHSSLRKSSRSSLSVSEADAALLSPAPSPTTSRASLLSTAVLLATCVVSATSLVSPVALIVPISPVHLRHAASSSEIVKEAANAALAPLLVQPSLPSLALAAVNLFLVHRLDTSTSTTSRRAKGALAAALWAAIVGLRVLASWIFGRVLGWAHPQFLSTRAIHEVGAGLAPLLLALSSVYLATSRRSDTITSSSCTFLAASFLVPVQHGGAGLWLGACAAIVGVVAALAITSWLAVAATPSTRSSSSSVSPPPAAASPASSASRTWTSTFLTVILVPSLALYPSTPRTLSHASIDLAFSQLHPADPTLVTVLLMTAPRPGDPDFLVQTIESWLGAFPDVDSPSSVLVGNVSSMSHIATVPSQPPLTSSRLRLVVYTHFARHLMFDLARQHFASSAKAAHYISWQRDPHALAPGAHDRLDQRLHVARGLAHAAGLGGAYVLLTEDDFPLCEDERAVGGEGARSWSGAWTKLQAALVATNELMPDAPVLGGGGATEASMGHCGLFLATGGSGLAIRTPLAARLPALLLGVNDPHGDAREAAAARGEIELRREGDGADTPDLVIQDCLRGRLPECAVCAPGGGPAGASGRSARRPSRWEGERRGKSGLAGTERLLQRHLGYNASTLPGRQYGREEWACGWRQPFNGEPDVLTV